MPLDESSFSTTASVGAQSGAPSSGLDESSFSTTAQPTAIKTPAPAPAPLPSNQFQAGGKTYTIPNFVDPSTINPATQPKISQSTTDISKLPATYVENPEGSDYTNAGNLNGNLLQNAGNIIKNAAIAGYKAFAAPWEQSVSGSSELPTGKEGTAQTVSDLAQTASNVAGDLFSPISAVFAAARQVPGLKEATDIINIPFTATGAAGREVATDFIDALPISQNSKDILKPAFGQLGTLAGQVLLGGKLLDMVTKDVPITQENVQEVVNDTKIQEQNIAPKVSEETKTKLAEVAQKHLTPETPTAPTDITNKLTDEGYSKQDISRIINDVQGDFTEEKIDQAKQNYLPKGKDAATIISDLSDKGYTPEEQNAVLKNLYAKNPDGNFMKSDINAETRALKNEDLYKTEAAKAEEVRTAEATKAQAITEKETAKAKAETEKFNAKVKTAQKAETQAKTEHDNAKNNSELAKGKIEDTQKDYEKSQKDQDVAQKRLQQATNDERAARIKLEESKATIADRQAKEDKPSTLKARSDAANAKVEATRAKVELEEAKQEAKDVAARTKLLQAELQKAKIEAVKAETAREKAEAKHNEAIKNTEDIKGQAPKPVEKTKTETPAEEKKTTEPAKTEEKKTTTEEPKKNEGTTSQKELKGKFAQKTEELLGGAKDVPDAEKRTWEEERNKSFDIVSKDLNRTGAILRGEEPIPEGISPATFWKTVKDYLDLHPNENLKNDLINSDIRNNVSETARNLNAAKIISKDAVAQGLKDAHDAMKSNNPKGVQQAEDIVKEVNNDINNEADKTTLEDFLSENGC